jgi:nucleoside-diphosphate-sugar epimerase
MSKKSIKSFEGVKIFKMNYFESRIGYFVETYRHFFADNSNLKLDTGWFVSTDLEEGIVKTVNKFKTN